MCTICDFDNLQPDHQKRVLMYLNGEEAVSVLSCTWAEPHDIYELTAKACLNIR